MPSSSRDRILLAALWRSLHGDERSLETVELKGTEQGFRSVYEVLALATASVGVASLAASELLATRTGKSLPAVTIERAHAARAFQSERLFRSLASPTPDNWDLLAGDYACADGFIRLHTNYSYHRDAMLSVLEVAPERASVTSAVASWPGELLERRVVEAGGAAAYMRSARDWSEHAQGRAVAREPLFALSTEACTGPLPEMAGSALPLSGIRVLDLTRVIAGPLATRFLAAYGADVLRIDPPGFVEVPLLVRDMTAGKRSATLDLRRAVDRETFEHLVKGAHVLVHGYRADALTRLGFHEARLRALNPELVLLYCNAYGWTGPWRERRGFDSLVQMSCGIASRGAEVYGARGPQPLPVQAPDHATGYLLAGAACRALTRRITESRSSTGRLSLARTAHALMSLGESADPHASVDLGEAQLFMEEAETGWGRVQRVRIPGQIAGAAPAFARVAGPLGRDAARW